MAVKAIEATDEERQERVEEEVNRQLHEQKAVVDDAVKVLADLENKLTTLRAKYKNKLKTAVKYLQEVAAEIESQISD
jgi:uncharacterized coiled-coil protein SlyX